MFWKLLVHILTFIVIVDASTPVWSNEKNIVVPLTLREGHSYYIHYDYKAKENRYDYAGIAVLIDVGEITFTKYPIEYLKKTGSDELCVTFQDGRGSQRKCSEYFLLVADRYSDVNDESSPKYVGTYSRVKDNLYYTDNKGERVVFVNFKKKIDTGIFSPDRYEVICATERK